MSSLKENISRAARILAEAEALMITAGAGMGVDSGLPDFRGNEGFWRAYPPMKKLGISFQEMANPHWFDADPELAWGFYGHRLNLYRQTGPHRGFKNLLSEGEKKRGGYFVFTSNVDGQFQKAGFATDKIEECHGSIHHLQCKIGCNDIIWSADMTEVCVSEDSFRAEKPLPRCMDCDGLARPNILMFGDWAWLSGRTEKQSDRLSQWLEKIRENKIKMAIVELGAGRALPTVRARSEKIAALCKGTLIRINPTEGEVPSEHISIPLGAVEAIDAITGNA